MSLLCSHFWYSNMLYRFPLWSCKRQKHLPSFIRAYRHYQMLRNKQPQSRAGTMTVTTSLPSHVGLYWLAVLNVKALRKGEWLLSWKWRPDGDISETRHSPQSWQTPVWRWHGPSAPGLCHALSPGIRWVPGHLGNPWPKFTDLNWSPFLEAQAPSSAISSSVSFPHRSHRSRSDPDPKTPHHKDQKEFDIDLFSEYEPWRNVLVSTRPTAGSKADLLFN